MGYERWHWRIYNVQWRLFSLMMVFVGVGFLLSAVFEAFGWLPPSYGKSVWWYAVLGLVVSLVGLMLLRRRTYRPDLGDVSWWAGKAGNYKRASAPDRSQRSWWTGDPKTRSFGHS